MLVPVSQELLVSNPHLAILHEYLFTHLLAPDASSINLRSRSEELENELRRLREAQAQDAIILRMLSQVASADATALSTTARPPQMTLSTLGKEADATFVNTESDSVLPRNLRELTGAISAYLTCALDVHSCQNLPTDVEDLMRPEIMAFKQEIQHVASVVSRRLRSTEQQLSKVAHDLVSAVPQKSSSDTASLQGETSGTFQANMKRPRKYQSSATSRATILPLDEQVLSTHNSINDLLGRTLPLALNRTVEDLSTVQSSTTDRLSAKIKYLERDLYGTQARYVQARSNFLSNVAKGIELKTKITRLEEERDMLTRADVVERIERAHEKAKEERAALDEMEKSLQEALREYDVAGDEADGNGDNIFRVLGTRYADVEQEMAQVKQDIERLKKQLHE